VLDLVLIGPLILAIICYFLMVYPFRNGVLGYWVSQGIYGFAPNPLQIGAGFSASSVLPPVKPHEAASELWPFVRRVALPFGRSKVISKTLG
jgi:hypothetical protein